MTEDKLLQFAKAWSEGTIQEVLDFFTKDAIYSSSIGPEPGKTYRGKDEIREGIRYMMNNDNGSVSSINNLKIINTYGFWEWTYRFQDGSEQRGCDLFEFEGDKIKMKNAFRKVAIK